MDFICSSSSARLVARAAINSAVPDYDCRCAVPALGLNLAASILVVFIFGSDLENSNLFGVFVVRFDVHLV